MVRRALLFRFYCCVQLLWDVTDHALQQVTNVVNGTSSDSPSNALRNKDDSVVSVGGAAPSAVSHDACPKSSFSSSSKNKKSDRDDLRVQFHCQLRAMVNTLHLPSPEEVADPDVDHEDTYITYVIGLLDGLKSNGFCIDCYVFMKFSLELHILSPIFLVQHCFAYLYSITAI